jgi:tetratricopeptide (TPR) repeat protein
MRWLVFAPLLVAACAPLAREHQADAAFRRAITAQVAGDADRAETNYREIVELGYNNWSAVWNNLAVIAARRHQYIIARHYLAHAVQCNDRDVVALTNYGVISYHLADLKVARKTLEDARALRLRLIDSIPPIGRADGQPERYAKATQVLERLAQKYLDKMSRDDDDGSVASMRPDEVVAETLRPRS